MNALISKAERQLAAAHTELTVLEEGRGTAGSGTADPLLGVGSGKLGEVSAGLATAMLTLRNLEESLSREIDMDRRQGAKQRLKELRGEHEALKARLEQIKTRLRASERATTRAALFSTPSSTASASAAADITEAILAAKEDATLRHAETSIGEYISLGTNTLDSLRGQRALLKGTQRRILDAGTRLGLSQSVMRVISRKTAQDRLIFYLGVVTVLGVMYLCWKYL